jgi:hypothetical protein
MFIIPEKVSKKEIADFIKEFDVKFPLTLDKRRKHVKRLHAEITPQAILTQDGSIVYTGAIDNWFYDLGKYRREATEHYLVDALRALSEGQYPEVKETEAIGCPIAMSD